MAERLLIVEDEATLCESLRRVFARAGYAADAVGSAEEALARLDEGPYDVVVTDIILPGMDGIELIERIRERSAEVVLVVITAYATIDTAMRAIQAGAYDYVTKPILHEELTCIVRNALTARALRAEKQRLQRQIRARHEVAQIVGESEEMRALLAEAGRAADAGGGVLLLGETGTGKELLARGIHARSPRRERPFVPVNCGALPEDRLEAELFGSRGGPSPAGRAGLRRGLLEEADGGTVFLDEVGKLGLHLQSRLLRVVEEGEFLPAGSGDRRRVDLRFVAASSVDLAGAVAEGSFRADLYDRLRAVTLEIPPLRRRTGDVPLLARHFLARFAAEFGRPVTGIDPETMRTLESYPWPGNVRELANVVERGVLFARTGSLQPGDLPIVLRSIAGAGAPAETSPCDSIEGYTKRVIIGHQGSMTEQDLASLLGITRKCLWEKRKRWNLPRP